jgi:hypothetical protein
MLMVRMLVLSRWVLGNCVLDLGCEDVEQVILLVQEKDFEESRSARAKQG